MTNKPEITDENLQTGPICPYPGLRPFAEEESLYFTGRDERIKEIIKQLEERKFVMLTGASGDGKSSLVYAGVIPEMRAGLFKAKFNNWVIADFRPERNPLDNIANTLATTLGFESEFVKTQLGYGFSALADIYKSTDYHIDYERKEWEKADEEARKTLKKKGANLLILVDQFEEFYTNPENYSNGKPSKQSQIVVNTILETAKIALKEDLPIYIICTMRSDYIGQCASFPGLPEYIGFSQFFVPRLKRKEMYQVVKEPALLSGNRISQRLVEILINELREGFDQLPVLQHALNKLWETADRGKSEMDLIHLAQLSGIPVRYLPKDEQEKFKTWFAELPEYRKKYFDHHGLDKVLATHANGLYETSHEYFINNGRANGIEQTISENDSKLIIKKVFQCLTKIDEGKTVRNRMTLQEITNIVNLPNIELKIVQWHLNIFREQGNTLISPFISEDAASSDLSPETVLDITHESLIRNWNRLKDWADEEYDNWIQFLDFKKQLQRWIDSENSVDYLLSIGPLTFFDNWYDEVKPNNYWLARYDERDIPDEDKLKDADEILKSASAFIEKSKWEISKARRAKRRIRQFTIAAATALIILLSGFSFWAYNERTYALDQTRIAELQKEEALLANRKAILAKNTANKAKIISQDSEKKALKAQKEAEKAKLLALNAKQLAEIASLRAKEQEENAKREAEKAEKQRKVAEVEKERAELAENRARKLSLLTLAQSLALKSTILDENKQLIALLAVQAYNFNVANGGKLNDPAIYEALRSSYVALHSKNPNTLTGSKAEPRSIVFPGDTPSLFSVGKDGILNEWNVDNLTIINSTTFNSNYQSSISSLYYKPDGTMLVTGHDNNAICLWGSGKDNTKFKEIKAHSAYIRAVAFNTDGNSIATAGKDSVIIFWDHSSDPPTETRRIESPGAVRSMIYSANGKFVFVALEKGDILRYSISSLEAITVYASVSTKPLSMMINNFQEKLIVGFSDGKVRIFDLKSETFEYEQLNSHTTRIEFIDISNDGKLMAVVGSDNIIKIYLIDYLESKPIVLKDHKTKVRCMNFGNDNKLFVGCADNSIRFWETEPIIIVEKIGSLVNRNLTQEEWEGFIGKNVEYENTF